MIVSYRDRDTYERTCFLLTKIQHVYRYAIRFQMFAIRQFSYVILQRLYSPFPIRYQSSTTTDLIETSPTDIQQKPPTDYTLWATSETNGLINYLSTRIKNAGPITVADFMREALLNPKYVCYYYHILFTCIENAYYHHSFRAITHDMKCMVKKVILSQQPKLVICSVKYEILYY